MPDFNEDKLELVEQILKESHMIEALLPGTLANLQILKQLLYSLLEDDDERMRSRFQEYADELMTDLIKDLIKKGYHF